MLETTWFYAPPSAFRGASVTLPEDEAHHLTNVLRSAAGEEIVVVDGQGGWYRVELTGVQDRHVVGQVVEEREEVGEPSYRLTVGIGVPKRRSRFETFVEKAVELGVSGIVPLRTDHTEKQSIRRERIQRVITAAMKQTRRSRRPTIEDVTAVDRIIAHDEAQIRLVCHGQGTRTRPLAQRLTAADTSDHITVLVGPEGGFSSREVNEAANQGWKLTGLGSRRLRTETAGIAAAAGIQVLLDAKQ